MKQPDFEPFCEMLDLIAEQCSKKLSDGLKMLYWQGLKDYDLPALQQAAYRHLRNPDSGQFMIKIADFTKMLEGTTQDSALVAWAKVDMAIRRVGTYQDVVFDDSIIHRVIHDMGGWIGLGTKSESEWPFVAKEFENRYRGFKSRSEKPEYPAKLIGIATAHNEQHGFPSDPSMLIGNELAAKQVLSGGSDKPAIGFKKLDIAEAVESLLIEPPQLRAVR
jgi:hypothetical protein